MAAEIRQVNRTLTGLAYAIGQGVALHNSNGIVVPPYSTPPCVPSTCAPAAYLGESRRRLQPVSFSSETMTGTRRATSSLASQRSQRSLQSAADGAGFGSAQEMNDAWRQWSTAELLGLPCTPPEAFTALSFDNAMMVQSNLGGQGGRCTDVTFSDGSFVSWTSLCDDQEPAVNTPANMHLLFRNLGKLPSGEQINLRVTNETEYSRPRTDLKGQREMI